MLSIDSNILLYDTRPVLTMTAQSVTEFATVNVKDFKSLGLAKAWNPLEPTEA